jgi:hypothetical protein
VPRLRRRNAFTIAVRSRTAVTARLADFRGTPRLASHAARATTTAAGPPPRARADRANHEDRHSRRRQRPPNALQNHPVHCTQGGPDDGGAHKASRSGVAGSSAGVGRSPAILLVAAGPPALLGLSASHARVHRRRTRAARGRFAPRYSTKPVPTGVGAACRNVSDLMRTHLIAPRKVRLIRLEFGSTPSLLGVWHHFGTRGCE